MNNFLKKAASKYENLPISAKAGIWFMICSVIQKSFSLITTPIFTRILTTEQFGQYTIYISWLQIMTIFCTFRLDYGVFNKGMTKYRDNKDAYTLSMQSVTNVMTFVLLLVYIVFRNPINQLTELNTIVTLFIFLELFFTPAMSFWLIRQRYDFKYIGVVIATIALSLMNLIVGLIAVFSIEDKGFARILSCVFVQTCFGCFFYITNLRKGKKLWKWEYIKFAIIFNIPLIPHYLSSYILEYSDRIIIQKLCGLEATALYSVAYNAGLIVKIFVNSINNALIPWQYKKLEKKEYDAMNQPIVVLSAVFALLLILFIGCAPELMMLFAGNQYLEAVYVIPPVAASMFFLFIYTIFGNLEFFYDANKYIMIISMLGAGVNVILNYIFVPKFGYIAAAYTTLVCYILFSIMHYYYLEYVVRKVEGAKVIHLFMLLPIGIGLLIFTGVFTILYDYMWIRYFIIVILSSVLIYKRKELKKIIQAIKS